MRIVDTTSSQYLKIPYIKIYKNITNEILYNNRL